MLQKSNLLKIRLKTDHVLLQNWRQTAELATLIGKIFACTNRLIYACNS
jgi:hypothetical protein